MKKVISYNERRLPMAISNYMPGCRLGHEAAAKEMKAVVTSAKSAEAACAALNAHRWTADRFTVHQVLENGFVLKAVDFCKNVHYIKVVEC